MALTLITPPAVEPITLPEAKANLRIDHTDDDAIITALIKAARQHLEGPRGILARALVTQTWELTLDTFYASQIQIPLPPLQSITSVKYTDADGFEQTVATGDYYVDTANEPGWIATVLSWPATLSTINAVRIRFVAGYAPDASSPPDLTANIPFDIKAAMHLLIGTLYEHREQVVVGSSTAELSWGATQLLQKHSMHLRMA